ncbi:TRAP transporter small permease [Paracoccus seriniphilus]|uniref:TRAP transporter small permease protein n=1 Tax=Paracoccus seriniphilus TaxID=184748 RepID=A0A239Q0J4_9RHOB|nr:TRAP transporter small permease [Paracoccus seriniphilus]WCR16342.1 TRAP transporter small permease [Paracoccus seriniphilus]SNT75773.1 TRAP-type C4-dicarboxylate transport system, small permease component [Paracoccus seriniphilus]
MSGPDLMAGGSAPDGDPGRRHRHSIWYRVLAGVSALMIAMLVGVTCYDVIGRYVFNHPFGGAYELTQMLLAALVFVALPLTSADGAHVEVDLALHLFPRRVQRLLGRLAGFASAVVLFYFSYRLVLIGLDQWHDGTRSASLALPMAPLAFLAAASCVLSAVAMILRREAA